MPKIIIETDLTNSGTKVSVDGTELTMLCDVSFSGTAPCDWTGEDGWFNFSYCESQDGTLKRTQMANGERNNDKCIGEGEEEDNLKFADFLGTIKQEKEVNLVDTIIEHCAKNNIPCPTKEVLEKRSEASLRDKLLDLGVSI